MIQTYAYQELSAQKRAELCKRPKIDFKSIFGTVQPIVDAVEAEGDAALKKFTRRFDNVDLATTSINPKQQEPKLSANVQQAIDTAFANIKAFHEAQQPEEIAVETMPGVRCRRISRPIERVGLYVPGGTAMLPSTLMMLGIPAMLAGCETIVMATPPNKLGSVADELIYIAKKIGVQTICLAGGAQAVAAMAFGTQTVPKVDKIFGPGNQYVTAAKMILQNSEAQVAIDMPAGPSEVLVIADATARPAFVAADLLSQAEHGPDSQVVLLATPGFDINGCQTALKAQLAELPRAEAAQKALQNSFGVIVQHLDQAIKFSNAYAPEHLIIQCNEAAQLEEHITNAGSIFLGHWSPESVGDYASGTNHTLPTYGYARMYSGVSLQSFIKFITVQELSPDGLKQIGPAVETLANLESLQAHRNAVRIRLNQLQDQK